MKIETILKVTEIIRRIGEQSKHIFAWMMNIVSHIQCKISYTCLNFYTHNCHLLYRITVYCIHTFIFYVQI